MALLLELDPIITRTTTYLPAWTRWSPAVARMLRRWSYKEGSGLGERGQGMVAPIQLFTQQGMAGIGYHKEPYDNGLPDTNPPAAQDDEWLRLYMERLAALELEEECCDKAIAALGDMMMIMSEEGDDGSAETVDALAALTESRRLFQGPRAPGTWKATLPSSATRYIVERVIKPGMAADAQGWLPAWDPDCHRWLRPWIPLVGHLPESLYDAVESKVLARAGKLDYYDVVSPWKSYLDPRQWDTFLRRHVLPMLARLVRDLMITPPKQTDTSFPTVMLWAHLVPVQDMVSILEQELFFDKYEGSLRHWLQSAARPSSSEAVAWCVGWKKLFTPELPAQERVLVRLDAVVALVDCEAYYPGRLQQPQQQPPEAFLLEDCVQRLQSTVL